MFENLNLNKTMFFKNDRPALSYTAALADLQNQLGITGELSIPAIEEKILKSLSTQALCLTNGKVDDESHATLVAFHRWAMDIHNTNLAKAPGAVYETNIVYDMLIEARKSSPAHILLFFFIDGLNARKIKNGDDPTLDFITTSFIVNILSTQPKPVPPVVRDFLAKYESILTFTDAQNQLVAGVNGLKNGKLFGFLSSQNVFAFNHEKNSATGANAYGLESSLEKGFKRLNDYQSDKLDADIQDMVSDIQTMLTPILKAYNSAKSTKPSYLVALWDASEYFCRAVVALQIAARYSSKYQVVVNELMFDPTLSQVYERSLDGNFPGTDRNNDIANLKITELFLQAEIAAELRSKNKLRA